MNQQGQWQVAGSAPEVYERELVPAVFGVWAPILVELAQPRPGERVVDVACGTGIVSRIAAARVGPTGAVVGVDLNPGMLSIARSVVSTDPSGGPLRWQEAGADRLPFPDGSFDVVYCQLGLQFFADRPAAPHEMRRVLGAGGRLALMVWRGINESPGFTALAEALERHVGQAAAAIMRAPFGLSNADEGRSNSTAERDGPFSFDREICVELRCGLAIGGPGITGQRCGAQSFDHRRQECLGKIHDQY